ncbi:MAG: exo-alpha-sialidase [Thermotogae bacterium]|nr:exo-alpha-sialidase [Thermotogota bacterium]
MLIVLLGDVPFTTIRVDNRPDTTSHMEVSGAVLYEVGGVGWISDVSGGNDYEASSDSGRTWGAPRGFSSECCDPVVRITDTVIHRIYLGGYETGYAKTYDYGITWTIPQNISACNSTDHPWIAYRNDTLVVIYADYCSYELRSAYSYDNGDSWARATVSPSGGVPMAAQDDSLFYALWWDYSSPCIYIKVASSLDGATWSGSSTAACMSTDISSNPYPAGYQGAGWGKGNLAVVYMADAGYYSWDVEVVVSNDGGRTWSSPVKVSDQPSANEYMPAIASDPYGNLHVFWYDDRAGSGQWALYYSKSEDGGTTWQPAIRVTDYYFPFIDRSGCGGASNVGYSGDCWPGHYIDAWADSNYVYVFFSDNSVVDHWHVFMAYAPVVWTGITESERAIVDYENVEIYSADGRRILIGGIEKLPAGVYFVRTRKGFKKVIRR